MNKKPTLAIIVISAGLMLSTSSQAFDLYAETDSNTTAPASTAPAKKAISIDKNKQEAIRTQRNAEKQQRHEMRKERMERREARKERRERREERKERMMKNNQRHNGSSPAKSGTSIAPTKPAK